MTKVSFLHGLPPYSSAIASNPAVAAGDIPAELAPQRFIDWRNLTVGQMNAALLAEQLAMQAAYFGLPELKQAQTMAENALHDGLHNSTKMVGKGDEITRKTAQLLRENARKRKPADRHKRLLTKPSTIGALIPMEDCDQYMELVEDTYAQYDGAGNDQYNETWESIECRRRNKDVLLLNEYLEPSSHHLLYEYLNSGNDAPGVVSTKYVLHRSAVSSLSDVMELDRSNMRNWIRNGILRSNIRGNAGPMQAERVISILQEGARDGSGVGAPPLFVVIMSIVVSAVGATASLLGQLNQARQMRIRSAAQGIGTGPFGPEAEDWNGYNSQTGQQPNENTGLMASGNLPYLLMGGAALLLLNDK